jgi:hypothetical protein
MKTEALKKLRGIRDINAQLDKQAARAVAQAREAGATWTEVGQSLGVSRQAAQQRYGGKK